MVDFVFRALDNAAILYKQKEELQWQLTFIDNKIFKGTITVIGENSYRMDGEHTFYFSAAHVVRMFPDPR